MATTLKHDPVTETLSKQITDGFAVIEKANDILLAEEAGTPVREIDKVLKSEDAELPENIVEVFSKYEVAYAEAKNLLTEARNLYRSEVLGEDAQDSVDDSEKVALKEQVKDQRKAIMAALEFLNTYSVQNGKSDIAEWAQSVEIPQVGRKATSTVGGSKKPRVYVTVDGEVHESFTKAALALSDKDKKFTAGELAAAWDEATNSEEGEFEYADHEFKVVFKTKENSAA